ncbi:hypothetical protein HMPREF1981_00844 [Bacteroides pyogenes F0041]|uniref:Uncharacterized protein n=1 Tax=Bacteroides pyogenes F0041 TaxID=1321819 RepID=U2CRB8_9BACE|nr:hypothetical protein HMPREF1981_00844 [Bacteroides pyogenes F0041]
MKYLKALDYLNPTHEYGVSFERGDMYHLSRHEAHLSYPEPPVSISTGSIYTAEMPVGNWIEYS